MTLKPRMLRFALAAIPLAAGYYPLHAQFKTPTIDGVIQPGEYGNTQNRTNQISTNTGQTWYMTWDASNLYVGISNANMSVYSDDAERRSGTMPNGIPG